MEVDNELADGNKCRPFIIHYTRKNKCILCFTNKTGNKEIQQPGFASLYPSNYHRPTSRNVENLFAHLGTFHWSFGILIQPCISH